MHDTNRTDSSLKWFPRERLDADFPMALWLAGLWFYLKSFLYICYLYMLGLDPTPYSTLAKMEIGYFAVAFIPALLLGMALWNQREKFITPAILFLLVDTLMLILHVMRLAQAKLLDSDLTRVLEYGSLALNVIALCWLIGYLWEKKVRAG